MTNELQTVGAMHQCRAGEPYSTCVHCGALAEALNKPCPHFMRDAAQKLAAVASPTPQADSQPAQHQPDVEGEHARLAIAIYSAATGGTESEYCRLSTSESLRWERAALAAREVCRDGVLFKIQEVVACAGQEWPDVPGEPEVLRRVKALARRAMQQADSQPAPVSSDTLYLLRRLLSNQHTLTGSEFREELTKIVGEATQAADSVLEDAARYRWLREQGTTTYIMRHRRYENCIQLLSDMGGELADAAIDAARKQGGKP